MTNTAPPPPRRDRRSLAGGGVDGRAAGLSCSFVARRRAILSALSVALRAIEGGRNLTRDDIKKTIDLVSVGFGLGSDIGFALGMVLLTRIDGGDLPARGRELGRAIERTCWPDQGVRADVWG